MRFQPTLVAVALLAIAAHFIPSGDVCDVLLHVGAAGGSTPLAQLALILGANVNYELKGTTALFSASAMGHVTMIELLHARGANLTHQLEVRLLCVNCCAVGADVLVLGEVHLLVRKELGKRCM